MNGRDLDRHITGNGGEDFFREDRNLPSYAIGRSSIATAYENPPIPDRRFDWVAYLPDCEGEGPTGYGATETMAIFNLCEELADHYLEHAK